MMNIAIYCRTNMAQVEANKSIDAQASRIKDWCRVHGHSVAKIFEEPCVSGFSKNPPVLNQLIEEAKSEDHPYDAIVVDTFSRLSRSQDRLQRLVMDLEGLYNVSLISIPEEAIHTYLAGKAPTSGKPWGIKHSDIGVLL